MPGCIFNLKPYKINYIIDKLVNHYLKRLCFVTKLGGERNRILDSRIRKHVTVYSIIQEWISHVQFPHNKISCFFFAEESNIICCYLGARNKRFHFRTHLCRNPEETQNSPSWQDVPLPISYTYLYVLSYPHLESSILNHCALQLS